MALLGCVACSLAQTRWGLTLARGVTGVGVSACLMAQMTCFRRRFLAVAQMLANSWMVMTGSTGMVASTLPVQWLLPHLGWWGLFGLTGLLMAAAMLLVANNVAPDPPRSMSGDACLSGYGVHGAFAILAISCVMAYAWFVGFDDSIKLSRLRAVT